MAHWSDRYVGIPYATANCADLSQLAQRQEFGRHLHFPGCTGGVFERSALIRARSADFAEPIDQPVDGCGVLFLVRGRLAHMGLYCAIDGVGYVLHTSSSFGSSTRIQLARMVPPSYKIEGWYAWRD